MAFPTCWSSFLSSACLRISQSTSATMSGHEEFNTSDRRWSSLNCASRVLFSSRSFAFWKRSTNLYLALVTWTSWFSMKATRVRVLRMLSGILALICSKIFLIGSASCTSILMAWPNSWRIPWSFSWTSFGKGVNDGQPMRLHLLLSLRLKNQTYCYLVCCEPAQWNIIRVFLIEDHLIRSS